MSNTTTLLISPLAKEAPPWAPISNAVPAVALKAVGTPDKILLASTPSIYKIHLSVVATVPSNTPAKWCHSVS